MNMHPVIGAIERQLGEIEHPYHHVVNFAEILKRYDYPDMPSLFGWGNYRQSEQDIFELGILSAERSLQRSGVSPKEIDFVYFCSTCFPGDEIEHIGYNARVMKRLGVANAFPIGITLNNCTSFLSAISIAVNMVRSGGARNILIVTADKVYDETIRFNNFALLSDAAASCIVTARPVAGYHLAASSFRAADDPIETNHGRDDSALYQRVFEEVMSQANLTSEQVAQVFCSNIFRSITLIKERKLGFAKKQLFLSNVSKYGHCFSADTFINLIEYEQENPVVAGEHYVISADAPNLRASIVLRRAEALACA